MARQFLALQRHPAALQLRYEDAAHDFNSTFSPVFKQFYPRVSVSVIWMLMSAAWHRAQERKPGMTMNACLPGSTASS